MLYTDSATWHASSKPIRSPRSLRISSGHCTHLLRYPRRNHTHTPNHNNRKNRRHLLLRAKAALLVSRPSGNARWHSCDASNVSGNRRRELRQRQARSMVAAADQAMWMYSIDVKSRTRIVSAIARGVTAAGRTMVGIVIADGVEFLPALYHLQLLYYSRSMHASAHK